MWYICKVKNDSAVKKNEICRKVDGLRSMLIEMTDRKEKRSSLSPQGGPKPVTDVSLWMDLEVC